MRRIRHHVNPLQSKFRGIARESASELVPATGEVEVELGCADARFLFERAAAHPDVTCIGVEIREDLVDDVNVRAREAGLTNLHAVFANANTDLDVLFPDERLARVFVNFPDPWFKRRHHKRRVMNLELAAVLARKLLPALRVDARSDAKVIGALGSPPGQLMFQSDIFELSLDAMSVLEDCELFDNLRGPWSFCRDNPFGASSLREVRCQERAFPIWRMLYSPRP